MCKTGRSYHQIQAEDYFEAAPPDIVAIEDPAKSLADSEASIEPGPTFTLTEIREMLDTLRETYQKVFKKLDSNCTSVTLTFIMDDFIEDLLTGLQQQGKAR